MYSAIISSESVSILFLAVLFFGLIFQKDPKSITTKLYLCTLTGTVIGTAADALSYFLEGTPGIDPLLTVINLIAICGCDLAMIPFFYYTWKLVDENETDKKKSSPMIAHAATIACVTNLIIAIIWTFTGQLFTVSDGVFAAGELYGFNELIQLVILLLFFIYVLSKIRVIGIRTAAFISSYFILPTIAVMVEFFTDSASPVYVATSLVMGIIYISLQQGEIENVRMREKLMMEVSNTDVLTKLNNRRAYELRLGEAIKSTAAGIIFCDLNGLKLANDKFGHAAGDDLILKFSNMLRQHYPMNDIYRISGDEFVVIRVNEREDIFAGKAEDFRNLSKADYIASVGFAYGMGEEIMATIRTAETEMYTEKELYYKKRGFDRAGNKI